VKTLAPLYYKEIPSPLSYKAWEIRRKESYSPKPKSKLAGNQNGIGLPLDSVPMW
jgi:hypothetical protein